MRIAAQTTKRALEKAYKRFRTLDAVVEYYGIPVSKGTLSRILRGNEGVSAEAEQQVRQALGLFSKPDKRRTIHVTEEVHGWLAAARGKLTFSDFIWTLRKDKDTNEPLSEG